MRIAAFQCRPIFDDLDRAANVMIAELTGVKGEAIDLALFPEAFILGHSYDEEIICGRFAPDWPRSRRPSWSALSKCADRPSSTPRW